MIVFLCRFIVICAYYSLQVVYTDVKRWQVSYIRNFLRKKKSWDLTKISQAFHDHDISWHDTAKNPSNNWMGPYQRTPKEVARAIRFSGLGVRSVGPVGDFLEKNILFSNILMVPSNTLTHDFMVPWHDRCTVGPPAQVLMFFAYIWLAVIVATLSWLLIFSIGVFWEKGLQSCRLVLVWWKDEIHQSYRASAGGKWWSRGRSGCSYVTQFRCFNWNSTVPLSFDSMWDEMTWCWRNIPI